MSRKPSDALSLREEKLCLSSKRLGANASDLVFEVDERGELILCTSRRVKTKKFTDSRELAKSTKFTLLSQIHLVINIRYAFNC